MDNIIKQRNEKARSIILHKQKEDHKKAVFDCINKWIKSERK